MNKVWKFTPRVPTEIGLDRLVSSCAVLFDPRHWQRGASVGQLQSDIPDVQLRLTLENFRVDCFSWESWIFVSERLRSVMALDAADIQFFDVDASGSAALPRSMHYKIMNIPVTEDISDPSKSDYISPEMYPGGPTGRMLSFAERIAIRSDVVPSHELFHDQFFGELFCTDALALRLLQFGCTGVRFVDPSHMTGNRVRFRTLRGVEEEQEWISTKKIQHTELVEVLVNTENGPQWTAVPASPDSETNSWKAYSWMDRMRTPTPYRQPQI